jgi:hypothetical protein
MGAHPAPPLDVTAAEVAALRSAVRAGTSEQRAVTRARIVLLAAEGVAKTRIAQSLTQPTEVRAARRGFYASMTARAYPWSTAAPAYWFWCWFRTGHGR